MHAVLSLAFERLSLRCQSSIIKAIIYLHVDDDGPGIKENEVNEIFNEFVTLETNASLSQYIGLGLMIAKTIVEKHKGKLTIAHSPLLAESRFTIVIER